MYSPYIHNTKKGYKAEMYFSPLAINGWSNAMMYK